MSEDVHIQRGIAEGEKASAPHEFFSESALFMAPPPRVISTDFPGLTFFEQLVQEIETQAIQSQQQISLVRSQIASKQREIRILELTSKEVGDLPSNTNIYEGVGKM